MEIGDRKVERECELVGTPAEVEEEAVRVGREVGRVLTEAGVNEAAAGAGRPCCCGRPMANKGDRSITLVALGGPIRVRRRRYRCERCGHDLCPADGLLRCGGHRVTRPLAKRVCQLATTERFTELPQLVFDQHGVQLSHEQILEMVHDVGGVADERRRAEAARWLDPEVGNTWPEPEFAPRRVYVSCDGILYCTNQREPHPRDPGRERLVWQQMRVGCVYWEDADGRWRKRVIWGRESPEEFGANLFRLACRCGYREAEEKIFAADGGDWCWSIRERYFVDADGILDWFHAAEHVWAAARELGADAEAVEAWAGRAKGRLWTEGGEGLVQWLGELRPSTRGRRRRAVDDLLRYVRPRQGITDYPNYRGHGWKIGTGMIESTAKQLVASRLKSGAMQWTESGALAITALRAHRINQNWHSFWNSLVLAT